jgi:hypothetical protein
VADIKGMEKEEMMVRYEAKTPYRKFVGCEDTLADAKAYVASLIENGVEILKVEYFDNETRIADIKAGRV